VGEDDDERERVFAVFFAIMRERGGQICALCGTSWREHVIRAYVWGEESITHNFMNLCQN